jgi:glycosyltransferase involved in cell wall biosynthesis
MDRKLVSIVVPCYNEEGNVEEVARRLRETMAQFPHLDYEHIFIDNASKDTTLAVLRRLAAQDRRIKVIVNARNFGHLRSPMHGMLQAAGDAVVLLFSDLQDPPELVGDFIREWEKGVPVVLGIKNVSEESSLMYWLRTKYYRTLQRFASIEMYENFTGFGLFDRRVIEMLRTLPDSYPYFRGMIAEIGYPYVKVFYKQKARKRGITKNNFYTLYDVAMLGLTNVSKAPMRLFTFFGFSCAALSLFVAVIYTLYKLLFWRSFSVGIAPVVIGIFFLGSVQLAFIGLLSEYIGAIHTQVMARPLVVERERINFEDSNSQSNRRAMTSGPNSES